MTTRKLSRFALIFMLAFAPITLASCGGDIGSGGVITAESSCRYNDNLDMTADAFIGKCRQGKIRGKFPGEYYSVSLREIAKDKSSRGKTAHKLLNDGRFKK